MQKIVRWDRAAYKALQKIYEYIRQDSPINAEKVRSEILMIVSQLPSHPKRYPLDRFKKNNNGDYRAFEKYSIRVAYLTNDKEIIILRVRHVKQEPLEY
jgi:plasmid stabilization system protein ParE